MDQTNSISLTRRVVSHQPALSFSISSHLPINRAGERTSNVLPTMKKLLTVACCMFLIECDQESNERSSKSVSKDDLELRIIDFVLIDPATGSPPVGAGYMIVPPQGDYPLLGKLINQDAEPFRFYFTWIAEKDEGSNIKVRVDGYEDVVIGLDRVKRCTSHLMNTRIPVQKIMLTPVKGEQAGAEKPVTRPVDEAGRGDKLQPEAEGHQP